MRASFLAIALLAVSCTQVNNNKFDKEFNQEHIVYSTVWFQKSAEAKALYYQGFNLAKLRVEEFVKISGEKPKAVVVDIDETMVDNSQFQGKSIERGEGYTSEFWAEWSNLAKAKALPGAVEFTKFCDSIGVQVVYISNRKVQELEKTMKNMDSLGFAFVNAENYLLKEETSGKEERRKITMEKYDIILLLGDNLNDFSDVFEHRGDDWGVSIVEEYRNEFGKRFIVFPNPMYGEWEKSIYGKQKGLTEEAKFNLRREAIDKY